MKWIVLISFFVLLVTACLTPPEVFENSVVDASGKIAANKELVDAPYFNSSIELDAPLAWVYQLQDASFTSIFAIDASYVVVDIDDADFSTLELRALQSQGKVVLSYLSIGEAEDYRSYWDEWVVGSPSFVLHENPDWEGNYIVEFWNIQWQRMILLQMEKIINAGYDGVYLDRVDVYEEFGVDYAPKMVEFIRALEQHAHAINSDFLLVPQNGLGLLVDPVYISSIDGIGKEDTWYDDDRILSEDVVSEVDLLSQISRSGKFVLAIDYPVSLDNQCDFFTKSQREGFFSTVNTRELDGTGKMKCS